MKKGDAIAIPTQLIAKSIDYVFGTNVKNCGGCKRMQNNLNAGMTLTDAIYDRWFKTKQKGDKMKYQIVIVVEADKMAEAVQKGESIGEVIAVHQKPESTIQPPKQ